MSGILVRRNNSNLLTTSEPGEILYAFDTNKWGLGTSNGIIWRNHTLEPNFFYKSNGVPPADFGILGEYYFDLGSNVIYQKNSSGWEEASFPISKGEIDAGFLRKNLVDHSDLSEIIRDDGSVTVYTRGFGSRILVVDNNNRFIVEEGARYDNTYTTKAYVYDYSGNLLFESSSDFRGSCTDGENIVFLYKRKREVSYHTYVYWVEFQVFDSNNNLIRTFGEEVDNYQFSGGRIILQDGIIYFLDTNTGDYFLNMLNINDSTYYGAINLDGKWPECMYIIGNILYVSNGYRVSMFDINTKLEVDEFDTIDLPDVDHMFYGYNFEFNPDDNCFYIGTDGYRDTNGSIRTLNEMILVYSPSGILLRQIDSPDSSLSGFGNTIHFLNGKLSASAPFSRRDQWNDFAGAVLFNDTVTQS